MSFPDNLTFSLLELVALLGLGQSLLILVHIIFRMTQWRLALPYFYYFLCLSIGFALQLTFRLGDYLNVLMFASWFFWAMSVPAGILMILSMFKPGAPLQRRAYLIFTLLPIGCAAAAVVIASGQYCSDGVLICDNALQVFFAFGIVAQTLSFLFLYRGFSHAYFIQGQNAGERYWLIICLIVLNLGLVGLNYGFLAQDITARQMNWVQIVIGLVFVYLASTLIFRVYPPALVLARKKESNPNDLSAGDIEIRGKIEKLMRLDKLYQEPNFGRSDLAREMALPESRVSAIVNTAFGMNLSQYINSYRIKEAKQLLGESDLAIKDISELAGFNSLASFNRVFKEVTGKTPSNFRKQAQKNAILLNL